MMMRWAVDIGGIDLESDLEGEEQKECVERFIYDSSELVKRRGSLPTMHHCNECNVIGELRTYSQAELKMEILEKFHKRQMAEEYSSLPVSHYHTKINQSSENDRRYKHDEENLSVINTNENDEVNNNNHSNNNAIENNSSANLTTSNVLYENFENMLPNESNQSYNFTSRLASTHANSQIINVFYTFLSSSNVRESLEINLKRETFRCVDVVKTFLQQMSKMDATFYTKFDLNPRLYKLFIADEITGEEEMAVQLDAPAEHFTAYVIQPLPAARLELFPQRTELFPTATDDINFKVVVRPNDINGKEIERTCIIVPDLLAESLEETIMRCLPSCNIVPGSLRIKYGPLELNINEFYDFGPGCGHPNCPIAEYTILALHRYGVTNIFVTGRDVNETSDISHIIDDNNDFEIEMDAESAMTFQQFEVVVINAYGARQQRLLCVDGEHLYTVRPNSSVKIPKATERFISDIEEVCRVADKPTYMNIIYSESSGFETDHLVFTTAYNCALVEEKLRVIKRELRKKAAESLITEQEVTAHNESHKKRIIDRLQDVLSIFYRSK